MATTQSTTAGAGTDAATDWLTTAQQRTLDAICQTLHPATAVPDGEQVAADFYARSARDVQVAQAVAATLAAESPETRAEFARLLDLLQQPLMGLLLVGRPQGFVSLSPRQREAALQAMSTSPLAMLRQGFQAIKRLASFVFYTAPVDGADNPNWPALGYVRPPRPPARESVPRRITPLAVDTDLTLQADAVVVGSGAGGGVVAAELAAAGRDVLILEKGEYLDAADYSGNEAEMTPRLYLRRGTLATHDLGMVVLAGSCLGGGTVVNWSTSLRTPEDVLSEWEREHGLSGATSTTYQRGFEVAEQRIGVNTQDSAPNANNAALQRGCAALGYDWATIPRNASDCQQRCGACGYGCQFDRKQSTLVTFLQDAHERGARVVVRCTVERVHVEAGRAVGVEGWALDAQGNRRRVVVRTPMVVVAAGAVESPALLLRSGLENPNIGRHLRLHPVAAVAGYYAEPIETWRGSLQTIVSSQFAHLRGGHGIRIEVAPTHPGLFGLTTPWEGGLAHKQAMRQVAFAATFIALARDTSEGRITLDRHGEPVLHYWPNETDRQHLIRGMQESARIAFAGGATSAATLHTPRVQLESEGNRPGAVTQAQLSGFAQQVARRGIGVNRVPLFSAHQMGTCRLGASAKTAVADPGGQVFGARGLYIADASGFPSASGVNPMLSTMALAYHVAQQIRSV